MLLWVVLLHIVSNIGMVVWLDYNTLIQCWLHQVLHFHQLQKTNHWELNIYWVRRKDLCELFFLYIEGRFSQHQISIKKCSKRLVEGAKKGDHGELRTSVRSVADTIAALENHCNSNIVKDALKDWYKALDVNKIPCKDLIYLSMIITVLFYSIHNWFD